MRHREFHVEFKKAHPKNTKNFENSTNRFKWSKNNEFLGSLNNVKPVMRREIDDSALEVATIKPFAQENKDQNNDETSTRYSNIASVVNDEDEIYVSDEEFSLEEALQRMTEVE